MKSALAAGLLLFTGLAQAAAPASHLDRVQRDGELRVCTTGDYKPYTYLREDGGYEGIDVSLAESLAKSLGVKVQWVPTTWKTMTPDMLAGKCDIAVGGVSVSLERQKVAFLSSPIMLDGKIPFVRCENVERFQTVAQINQPNVTLIEPPGGTNEAFVHKNLPQAKLTLEKENLAIFQQLVDKQADVMITDASEARYQSQHYPELCAVNPETPMQYIEKAFLLPRDDIAWKSYVDQWLHLAKATGEYQQIADRFLAPLKK
jgi:cyclohexadienyl dehydratase